MAVGIEPPPLTADLLIDGRPDWQRIDFDLECRRCGYNVRMLEMPRCPECGLEFSWHDLLHAHFTTNRFLFEHQWRNRPVGSFLITAAKCFRPWRFWSEVSLYDRVRVVPLIVFTTLALPAFCVFLHGGASVLHATIRLSQDVISHSDVMSFMYHTTDELSVRSLFRGPSRHPHRLIFDGLFIGMFVGAAGIVLLLQETLAKCRVRSTHVVRVMAYSILPGAALSTAWVYVLLVLYAFVAYTLADATLLRPSISVTVALHLVAGVPFGILIGYGLDRYLRVPRAYLIGVTAAFVGLLAAVAIPAGIAQLFR